MILCTDVDYKDDGTAVAAGVTLEHWSDDQAFEELVVHVDHVEPYVPGQFYKRELPCIQAVMAQMTSAVSLVLVDGYTWLSPGRKGLGAHLWDALGGTIPVVGVAKAWFKNTAAIEVTRGTSKRPLFVTAQGIDPVEAAREVTAMAGASRFPNMLKRVDHLCRGHVQPKARAS
jgi:deoxyribonuclease V